MRRRTCFEGKHSKLTTQNTFEAQGPINLSENETRSHTQHAVSERVCISGGGTTRNSEAVVNARVDLAARDNENNYRNPTNQIPRVFSEGTTKVG
jgi:hypothetical protein